MVCTSFLALDPRVTSAEVEPSCGIYGGVRSNRAGTAGNEAGTCREAKTDVCPIGGGRVAGELVSDTMVVCGSDPTHLKRKSIALSSVNVKTKNATV